MAVKITKEITVHFTGKAAPLVVLEAEVTTNGWLRINRGGLSYDLFPMSAIKMIEFRETREGPSNDIDRSKYSKLGQHVSSSRNVSD